MPETNPAPTDDTKPKRRFADGTEFITAHSLAERWGVKPSTIWRWAAAGTIPKGTKLGPQVTKWSMRAIEAYEAEQTAPAQEAGTA
jgi:predicted DNA-binding transcriptional regulator AlpA